MSEALMSAVGLSKTYRRKGKPVTALTNVSLSVQAGEFVAIVGRSGSGKSTLLSLLGGLDQPESGEVCFGTMNLSQNNRAQAAIFRRETIGYLFQSIDLLPSLTALENVALPAALEGVKTGTYRQEAAQAAGRGWVG